MKIVTSELLRGLWKVEAELEGGMTRISTVNFPHWTLEVPTEHLIFYSKSEE